METLAGKTTDARRRDFTMMEKITSVDVGTPFGETTWGYIKEATSQNPSRTGETEFL